MYDTFYIIDLMLLFSLSWFVLLPDYLSCYDYVCSVLRTRVVMSAICIFGVVSLFFVRVLYFSCCSLLSVEDEFLLS